jgi:tRNA 2-thiouridine synthesizing protein A
MTIRGLDVRGEICPYPMLRAVETLKQLAPGDGLVVVTDHPPALSTIPWEAAKLGYEASIEPLGDAEWRIALRRAADPNTPPAELAARAIEQAAALSLPE